EKSPDCLACHTTGFGRDDGYLNYNITAGLKEVNCTECHYVAPSHPREPVLNPSEPLTEAGCRRCHDEANSPGFEFASYVQRIRHPVMMVEEVLQTEPLAEEAAGAEETVRREPSFITHQVRAGESLWSLAEQYLGKGSRWTDIYELNQEVIRDPDMVLIGQVLKISPLGEGE
ncbi:MAG: multiheme c-type cytochrome, partial [Fidelibacterota bacterium]